MLLIENSKQTMHATASIDKLNNTVATSTPQLTAIDFHLDKDESRKLPGGR